MNSEKQIRLDLPTQFKFDFQPEFSHFVDKLLVELNSAVVITLDFAQVRYIDSAALGMMLRLKQTTSDYNDVQLHIKNAQGTVKDILKMSNIGSLFTVDR